MEQSLNSIRMKNDEKVMADDLVEVTGTGLSPFLKEGVKKTLHRIAAENLEAKGYVTIGEEVEKTPKKTGKKSNKL